MAFFCSGKNIPVLQKEHILRNYSGKQNCLPTVVPCLHLRRLYDKQLGVFCQSSTVSLVVYHACHQKELSKRRGANKCRYVALCTLPEGRGGRVRINPCYSRKLNASQKYRARLQWVQVFNTPRRICYRKRRLTSPLK